MSRFSCFRSRVATAIIALCAIIMALVSAPVVTAQPEQPSNISSAGSVPSFDDQAVVLYLQGTQVPNLLTDLLVKPMDQIFLGAYGNGTVIDYPASLGWLSVVAGGFLKGKFSYPTSNVSVEIGQQELVATIKSIRTANPTQAINIVGLSQGTLPMNGAINQLHQEGFDTTGIRFIAAGNPARANGGFGSRVPIPIPLPGIFTAGGNTNTSIPPTANGAEVILISNQYDTFSDTPAYLLNPLALANWALGAGFGNPVSDLPLIGPHVYDYNAIPDPNDPTSIPGAIVKKSGNLTDVLIPAPVGRLPLTAPLRLFVPARILEAIDPILRAIIEEAYDRDADPAERKTFRLLPPASQREENQRLREIAMRQTLQNIAGLFSPRKPQPATTAPEAPPSETPPEQEASDRKLSITQKDESSAERRQATTTQRRTKPDRKVTVSINAETSVDDSKDTDPRDQSEAETSSDEKSTVTEKVERDKKPVASKWEKKPRDKERDHPRSNARKSRHGASDPNSDSNPDRQTSATSPSDSQTSSDAKNDASDNAS